MHPSFQFTETTNWIILSNAADSTTWLTGIGVLVIFLLLISKSLFRSVGKPKLPPGPWNLPMVGALFIIDKDPLLAHAFTKMAKKYGPVFYCRLGQNHVIVVSSSEGAKEVLKEKDALFAIRENTTLFRTATKYIGFNKQSFAMSDNNEHLKTLRRVPTMQFFTTAKLSTYENMHRYKVLGAMMTKRIESQIKDEGGARINVREVTVLMSANITCMLFGERFSNSSTDEFKCYQAFVDSFTALIMSINLRDRFPSLDWLTPPGKRLEYEKFRKDITLLFGRILEEHRQVKSAKNGYEDRDLADVLLTLEKEGQVSEDEIMVCLLDMLSGGVETSSTTSEWALLQLVRHPECMDRLQNEIDTVVGKDRPVEESDFESMPYLQAVVMETFRLHGPVPLLVPHCNRAPTTLGGYYVTANTTVFVNIHAIGRDPQFWENPDEFQPERFIQSSSGNITITNFVTGGSFKLLRFGSGRRRCVGYNLGMLVAQRMLASLVHPFHWAAPPGLGIHDLSTKDGAAAVNQPEDPVVLSATSRLAPGVYSSSSIDTLQF